MTIIAASVLIPELPSLLSDKAMDPHMSHFLHFRSFMSFRQRTSGVLMSSGAPGIRPCFQLPHLMGGLLCTL